MEDIDKVLAIQIKKDIAERYFGLRKIIEDDSAEYQKRIVSSMVELETGVGLDLIRLYVLLHAPDLIERFQDLTGIPKDIFYDPYVCASAFVQQRIFAGQRTRGITRKRRFNNLILDLYDRLHNGIAQYLINLEELREEHETIQEQINLFYQKNDLAGIMTFIRSLDHSGGDNNVLNQSPANGYDQVLEGKMKLSAPKPAETLLPDIPAIPPLYQIKRRLLQISGEAFVRHPDLLSQLAP